MAAEHGGSQPDPYEVLGVDRSASREEIVRAWRQRARAEHPDSRPRDAGAPARFRALAEAYRVLGDPARRAAYDRAAGYDPRPRAASPDGPPLRMTPVAWVPDAPLWAGPVRVEVPGRPQAGGSPTDEEAGLAVLAELALWYLAGGWERPW